MKNTPTPTSNKSGKTLATVKALPTVVARRTPTTLMMVRVTTTPVMTSARGQPAPTPGQKNVKYRTNKLQLAANDVSLASHNIHPTSNPTIEPNACLAYR